MTENDFDRTLHLNCERDRLKTFSSWTNPNVEKEKLAKYGFYYKGPNDAVKCIYCGVAIMTWSIGDDPLIEHLRWSPNCPFLSGETARNIPIDSNFEIILKENTIRHPDYHSQEERLKSFQTWPKSLKTTPQALSEAGFFYLGESDQVKCFYCGGALRNWVENDEPWIEHARIYKNCKFVKERKGEQFSEEIIQNTNSVVPTEATVLAEPVSNAMPVEYNMDLTPSCHICLNQQSNVIFYPCMHVCSCENCNANITHCPVCEKQINEIKRCFIP